MLSSNNPNNLFTNNIELQQRELFLEEQLKWYLSLNDRESYFRMKRRSSGAVAPFKCILKEIRKDQAYRNLIYFQQMTTIDFQVLNRLSNESIQGIEESIAWGTIHKFLYSFINHTAFRQIFIANQTLWQATVTLFKHRNDYFISDASLKNIEYNIKKSQELLQDQFFEDFLNKIETKELVIINEEQQLASEIESPVKKAKIEEVEQAKDLKVESDNYVGVLQFSGSFFKNTEKANNNTQELEQIKIELQQLIANNQFDEAIEQCLEAKKRYTELAVCGRSFNGVKQG